ncbi:hypothetical protein [Goodfellowiella coeruleoviolacea]|nr:hypothetical protein [Goodfellowiella coeruleoviolacea]
MTEFHRNRGRRGLAFVVAVQEWPWISASGRPRCLPEAMNSSRFTAVSS